MRCRRLRVEVPGCDDTSWPLLLLLLLLSRNHEAVAGTCSIGVIRPRVVWVAALDDVCEECPSAGALAGAGGATGPLLLHADAVPADFAPPGGSATAGGGGSGGTLVVRVVARDARGLPAVALAPARLPFLCADAVIADGCF